jgi:hypothetical protein
MSDIFIAFARKDRDRAKLFVEALERQGWLVFWDLNPHSPDDEGFCCTISLFMA